MGACFLTKTLKARNAEQIRKEFAEIFEEANYMSGHSGYSGDWNTTTLKITNMVFNTFDDAEARISDSGEKGIAYAVQVKVFKTGKRVENVNAQIKELCAQMRGAIPERTKKAMMKKLDALEERRANYLRLAGAKSTKTNWVLMGWACS